MKKQYVCPKCGIVEGTIDIINISIDPYKGKYCLRCYAKWIKKNISELKEVKPKERLI